MVLERGIQHISTREKFLHETVHRLCIQVRDYSFCKDISTPDYQQHISKTLPPLEFFFTDVSFIVYIYIYIGTI